MKMLRIMVCLLPGIVLFSPAQADQQVYRCTVHGKTTFTDKPCEAPNLPSGSAVNQGTGSGAKPANSFAIDYTTPYGSWSGQAQYQASMKGQIVPEAHAVVPLVIEVEQQGKVRAASPENGCQMLGVAMPIAPTVLKLDVTLSDCSYQAYNRRYSGTLALYKSSNTVELSLQSLNIGLAAIGTGAGYFDIKATLRR